MIMASEVGVYDVEPADVVQKGRLMPGLFTSGQLMHFRFNRKSAVCLMPAFKNYFEFFRTNAIG